MQAAYCNAGPSQRAASVSTSVTSGIAKTPLAINIPETRDKLPGRPFPGNSLN